MGASLLAGLLASLGACASLPPLPPRTVTRALAAPQDTTLGQRVAAEAQAAKAPAGSSGLRLLVSGEQALATLIGLADAAERTLDLQYYAVLNERSTRVLLDHVQGAADRGVRVRLLVDDFNTAGTDDALLRLTRHPGIAVRLYNPLPGGRFSLLTKIMASLHDVPRINSRMHNKQLVADNAVAVTGGRNLGDAYFLQAADANFVDLDVLTAGPAVQQLSATFDRYWNSELAYPASVLIAPSAAAPAPPASADTPGAAPPASGPDARPMDAPDDLPEGAHARVLGEAASLQRGPFHLEWAPARLLSDAPSKSLDAGEPPDSAVIFDNFIGLLRSARHEVLIVSAYFVPGDEGLAALAELRERGVRVRVLTASMAGTDAPAVHIGYSRYRERLLAMGVELYELRAVPGGPKLGPMAGVHSRTNLHAKAAVIDGGTVMVGSMNFDPRSAKLNTEMALVARSTAIGGELGRLLDRFVREGAYRLALDGPGGALRWHAVGERGEPLTLADEPDVPLWKRLSLKLLMPLAPEQML